MIFTPGVQDLCLQAFLLISVKLCCKGLLDMSKGIGIWLLGSMQGIPMSPGMFSPSGMECSVPGHGCTLGTSLVFGFWGEACRTAYKNLEASPGSANSCQLFVIFSHVHWPINSIFRVQTKPTRREWEIM